MFDDVKNDITDQKKFEQLFRNQRNAAVVLGFFFRHFFFYYWSVGKYRERSEETKDNDRRKSGQVENVDNVLFLLTMGKGNFGVSEFLEESFSMQESEWKNIGNRVQALRKNMTILHLFSFPFTLGR